jgi:hypothetical protein
MPVWQGLAAVERRAVRDPVPARSSMARQVRSPRSHTVTFKRPKTERHHRQIRGSIMLRDRNTPLVEAIDNAIEEAEDRGLTFIASILMMARLEADQSTLMTRRVNDEHA